MKAIQLCLFPHDREEEITLHPEMHSVGKESIAKVKKRNGKKVGSYCGSDTFIATERPQNKKDGSKRLQEAQQLVLPLEDERLIEEALPS
jgi:hypothetical protein